MATGYTDIIERKPDLTFREFALRCARAFSPCIMQRDESLVMPPRHRDVDPYYRECVDEAEAELRRVEAMTDDDIMTLQRDNAAMVERARVECAAHVADLRAKYARMRAMVESWAPPTAEHSGLQAFMLSQIDESVRFGCHDFDTPPLTLKSADDARGEMMRKARAEVIRCRKALRDEEQRCREANAWIDALYNSLPPPET